MKLKWGLIGILIGILSACQSSNQPMDITYPQPSINIPAEGQKPPIDSEVEINNQFKLQIKSKNLLIKQTKNESVSIVL